MFYLVWFSLVILVFLHVFMECFSAISWSGLWYTLSVRVSNLTCV